MQLREIANIKDILLIFHSMFGNMETVYKESILKNKSMGVARSREKLLLSISVGLKD